MAAARRYILIAAILLLYTATLPLNTFFKGSLLEKNREPDIIQNIFGGMRSFVSDWAFMKAEEYHHRGLPFMEAVSYHHGESTLMSEVHGAPTIEHHHAEGEEKRGLFSRIYRSVKVTEDSHLAPSEDKEVLPWFYTEVLFNPHDIRGYVLGGYWLKTMGRYDEALKFLKEGEKNNPDSAQILSSIGDIYNIDNKYEDAILCLERARALWLKGAPPNSITNKYIESDRMIAFELLGHIYEKTGQYEKAVKVYSELLGFWESPAIEEKIIKLKNMAKER